MSPRHTPASLLAVSLASSLLLLFTASASQADDHLDRLDPVQECHAPVPITIDPNWRHEVGSFRDSSLKTFARFLGDKELARSQVLASLQLADTTRANAFDVIEMTKELLIRGFRGKDLVSLRAALLDIQATLGAEPVTRFTKVISAVHDLGWLSTDDLTGLRGIVGGEGVKDALGKRLNLRGTENEVRGQVTEKLKGKTVDAQIGITAVLDALKQTLREAALGDSAQKALLACVALMSQSCPHKEAEAHCKSTPREHMEILRANP